MKIRKPNRLKDFDYSSCGCYFITICTHNRIHHFGEIMSGTMKLNEFGEIAAENWNSIPLHFDNVLLDEFIVMPNHIHGIIGIIDNLKGNPQVTNINPQIGKKLDRSKMLVSRIVQQYKASVTRDIHNLNKIEFKWQRSFYDHIIRNERSYENIQSYIYCNPLKWEIDVENRKNGEIDSVKYYSGIFNGEDKI